MGSIVVLGSLNTDFHMTVPRLPRAGETVLGTELLVTVGGKGANQAAAAARLGGDVQMIGRVGSEDHARAAVSALEKDGVDTSGVVIDPSAASGAAVVLVDEAGQNQIAVVPGANYKLDLGDVLTRISRLSQRDVLLMQLEIPMGVVEAASATARDRGAVVILNAAPSSPMMRSDFDAPIANVLVVNETEASELSNVQVETFETAEQAAKELQRLAPCVIVTLGPAGLVVRDRHESRAIKGISVPTVDSTAAGDAFVGALAVGIHNGWTTWLAARVGAAAGAAAATRIGAHASLPYSEELGRLFGITWQPGEEPLFRDAMPAFE